jgi:hypothetical protein
MRIRSLPAEPGCGGDRESVRQRLRLVPHWQIDLSDFRGTAFQVRHAIAGKERFMKKIRTALVAISTLALVVLASGIAEALPRLRPNW